MGKSKFKTVFQSYRRPEGFGRWKLVLTGILGVVTLGGLGIGAYHVVNDSSESLMSSRDSMRQPVQTYTPPYQAPVEKKPFSFSDLNPLAKDKPKAKKKSFAEKKRLSKKKNSKLAKKHKKNKKSKLAKNKKKHKKIKLQV